MRRRIVLSLAVFLLSLGHLQGQAHPEFQIHRAATPPKIDGILDDEIWKQYPLPLGDWVSYSPLNGKKMDQHTDVRIAYDDRYIYFAFKCFDSEPDKIRTNISRRDTAFNDDWIAMSLDSAGTGQTAYHLFINPSGSQMDALNTSASGEQFDADVVWDSAAKVNDDGYSVEVRLPLQSIRFSGGGNVRMGLLFFRKISRTGVSYSWPPMPPGQWVFDQPSHIVFANLKQPKVLEVLPSVTYAINQTRAASKAWNSADTKADVGFSAKYGITSNVVLDATVNPDFSQVESDGFQVQVNQRFPIFYSEKRPFFMEGMGLFNIAGGGNLRTAVHTRNIVNPFWGSKLTGTAGKFTFGMLNSADETPQDIGNRGAAVADKNKYFTIGRATYALGKSNYAGAIVTDTEHFGRHNRTEGGDLSFKFSPQQQFSATFLASQTGFTSGSTTRGTASQMTYNYNSHRVNWNNQVEHYAKDFQMDTAFYNRTGFTAGSSHGQVNFYPEPGKGSWLKLVNPYFDLRRGRDQVQDGNEASADVGVGLNLTRQGYVNFNYSRGYEPWIGRRFHTGGANIFAGAQIFRWLNISGNASHERQIYYDPVNPFQGESTGAGLSIGFQPKPHISQTVDVNTVRFKRASTGGRVFDVTIVNTRTTYQFSKRFQVRLLEEFDSSSHHLLTDLLASYEFMPGTVFHAGYGSLYEKQTGPSGALVPNNFGGNYTTVSRGLFFKASYLYRF